MQICQPRHLTPDWIGKKVQVQDADEIIAVGVLRGYSIEVSPLAISMDDTILRANEDITLRLSIGTIHVTASNEVHEIEVRR